MPLEQIDPIIKEVIEELKLKNTAVGEAYESNVMQRALMYVDQSFEAITRKIKIIDGWYDHWLSDAIWSKVKEERPSMAKELYACTDKINEEYQRFKNNKSGWSAVEKRLDDYGNAWRNISIAFPK